VSRVEPQPITIRLHAPRRAVDSAAVAVRRRVRAELAEVFRDLGFHAEPQVQLEQSDEADSRPFVTIDVGGVRCPLPGEYVSEAIAYVDGAPQVAVDGPAELLSGEDLDGGLSESVERTANVLACVCRTAISASPELLVASDDVARRSVLAAWIRLGGESDHKATVEEYIAAHASETIDILVERSYFERLIADAPGAELFSFARDGLFTELGLGMPRFRLVLDDSLRPGGFAFRVNAVRTAARIGLPSDRILVNDTSERLAEQGFEAVATLNPATWKPAALVDSSHAAQLEDAGLTTWNPWGFLILCFAAALRSSAHRLMTRNAAGEMVAQLGQAFPVLENSAAAYLDPETLTAVLRELLLDGVSIRNLRRIVELLLQYETGDGRATGVDRVSFVRVSMADAIAHKISRGTNTVVAYLLDPQVEDALVDRPHDTELGEKFVDAVQSEMSELPRTAQTPAILTQQNVRARVRALLRHEIPYVDVIAHGEIPPGFNVMPVARIAVPG
jgi:type III secretory pathway component EscV